MFKPLKYTLLFSLLMGTLAVPPAFAQDTTICKIAKTAIAMGHSLVDAIETAQVAMNDWKLVLVNEKNPLPEGFTVEVSKLPNGKEFDSRAIGELESMINAAKADGVSIFVTSSYRSYDYQVGLFNRKINQYKAQGYNDTEAYNIAKTIVAIPGTSEHNLGLAADIITPSYQVLDEGFAETEAFKWLSENAADYGFILRYPKGKGDITGIIYEPWHYRYVGQAAARAITEQGICLEEYLNRI